MKVQNIRTILIATVVVLLILGCADARKSSGRRSGGWGFGSRTSRPTPRPRPQTSHTQEQSHGSQPGKIGWNVPEKKPTGTHTASKPSAPESNIAKSSATNVQSGYSPSGGYPKQPASNPYQGSNQYNGGHNPSGGYNPPVGGHMTQGGYNPSPGQYNPSYGGQPHNPSYGQPYNPAYGGHYNPSYGGVGGGIPSYGGVGGGIPSYGGVGGGIPSYGGMGGGIGGVPQQTILLQQQSKPGIGQLAKEAFVYAGVSAGVNAAVNRIIPGGIYGTRGSSSSSGSGAPGVTHTEITYNNYYNNGTAIQPGDQAAAAGTAPVANAAQPAPAAPGAPAAPAPAPGAPAAEPAQASQTNAQNNAAPANSNSDAGQQNNPNPLGYIISNDDIKKLSEDLFTKDKNNAFKHITINLQGQKKDESTSDDAAEPLLTVKDEAYEIPTIKAVLALHDNYELDVKTKETVTSEERREEDELLDKFLETDVMKATMKFLASKGYIPDDEYEFKDTLKRIWFSQFKRIDGDASSSGFETVFLAEKFDSDIIGLHDWIYYAKQEGKKLNYLGYIKETKLDDKAAIIKLRSSLNDIVQPVTTIFVGTSPELEMALYTICFFTRPNNVCPMTMGGQDFVIIANRVNYFGKDIMISAYPDI